MGVATWYFYLPSYIRILNEALKKRQQHTRALAKIPTVLTNVILIIKEFIVNNEALLNQKQSSRSKTLQKNKKNAIKLRYFQAQKALVASYSLRSNIFRVASTRRAFLKFQISMQFIQRACTITSKS